MYKLKIYNAVATKYKINKCLQEIYNKALLYR